MTRQQVQQNRKVFRRWVSRWMIVNLAFGIMNGFALLYLIIYGLVGLWK